MPSARPLSTLAKSFLEQRQAASDSSVHEARKVVFGHWQSEGKRSVPFKSLRRIRRGWLVPKAWDLQGPRPKPNLRPPGHSEEHLIDFGRKHFAHHPVARLLNNLERVAELDDRTRRGKGPPKKGANKRSSTGKKK